VHRAYRKAVEALSDLGQQRVVCLRHGRHLSLSLFSAVGRIVAPPTLAVLLGLSDELLTDLGEPNRSRTADGARSTTTAFPWALAAGALNERL
jgi:hypothetical protein